MTLQVVALGRPPRISSPSPRPSTPTPSWPSPRSSAPIRLLSFFRARRATNVGHAFREGCGDRQVGISSITFGISSPAMVVPCNARRARAMIRTARRSFPPSLRGRCPFHAPEPGRSQFGPGCTTSPRGRCRSRGDRGGDGEERRRRRIAGNVELNGAGSPPRSGRTNRRGSSHRALQHALGVAPIFRWRQPGHATRLQPGERHADFTCAPRPRVRARPAAAPR